MSPSHFQSGIAIRYCRILASVLILICIDGWMGSSALGQVYQSVAPPPMILTAPGFNQMIDHGSAIPEVIPFDAFDSSRLAAGELRPWQTLDIPPFSFGNPQMWTPADLNSTTIQRFRSKFVQKVSLSSSFLPRDGANDLGYSTASASVMMVVPLDMVLGKAKKPSGNNVLAITPGFETYWTDGPRDIDVPAQLHGAQLEFGWRYKFRSPWSTIIGVRPGIFTDFDSEANGFRLSGLGLVGYEVFPERLTVMFGAVYLDRNDFNILPAVGLTWVPNPDTRLELSFPKPKIARRITHVPYVLEDWVYVAASFGGGTWTVQRTSGLDDELTLKDYRVSLGFERLLNGGTGFNMDIGYAFGRELEYLSTGNILKLEDSVIVEAGLRF